MQLWITFVPGCGGDGLCNLLEHCDTVETLDNRLFWRIHYYVNSKPKFWMPSMCSPCGCFRRESFSHDKYTLDPRYLELVNNKSTIIVPNHDMSLQWVESCGLLETFTKDRISILIRTADPPLAWETCHIKNLHEVPVREIRLNRLHQYSSNFDFEFFIEDILSDWLTFKSFTSHLGLTIEKIYYDHFVQIIKGEVMYALDDNYKKLSYFESYVDHDNRIRYVKTR
jgi:hypothetical protein